MTTNTDDKQTELQEVTSEIDVPMRPTKVSRHDTTYSSLTNLSDDEIRELERKAEFAQKLQTLILREKALGFMIGCLVGYLLIVIADTIVINIGMQTSTMTNGFVELVKFIISTLIGFTFSESLKNDNPK